MAAVVRDLDKAIIEAEERKFNSLLLWRTLTNSQYEGTVQGKDYVDLVAPDTSAVGSPTKTSGGTNAASDSTRNPDPPTAVDVTTSRIRMYVRERATHAFKVGIDDIVDVVPDLIRAAEREVASAMAKQIDADLRVEFAATVPAANKFAIGSNTNFVDVTSTNATFGHVTGADADADLIYNALLDAELRLEDQNIIHTGEVDYQPFAVMHPAMWQTVRRRELDKTVFTSRDELIESGADVNRGRIVGRLFNFDVYTSTRLPETKATTGSGNPNTMPIYIGHPLAVTFAQTMEQVDYYPPGTDPNTFGYKANFYRRYGFQGTWPALAWQITVTTSDNK